MWIGKKLWRPLVVAGVAAGAGLIMAPTLVGAAVGFAGSLSKVSVVASTVPADGDVNPYGVAVAPTTTGRLVAGDVLVSNFNDGANLQGTGETIVEVSPAGGVMTFAHLFPGDVPGACPGGIGLTTALVALRSGWVVVGSLPTRDGTSATMKAGCLIVLNPWGTAVETISGPPINGPWDMTALDGGSSALLFVSNVLNGTVAASPNVVDRGTVVRIGLVFSAASAPVVTSKTVIGEGFPEVTSASALVVGPTGLGLGRDGSLYVADTETNRIAVIHDAITPTGAGGGTSLSNGGALNGPLGLAIAPDGDILTVNGGNGNLVEITPGGVQVAVRVLDNTSEPPLPNGNGTLFGLAVAPDQHSLYFVDDGTNTLNLAS
ncbi:MAG: hypothetical protein ABSC16_07030 [Candidatus Dormibacteria bacterium]|nr:hypothetical protein [Chloroflexota bacterium]HBV93406.1 hypothetical protein [Chloroflexota bacterium]